MAYHANRGRGARLVTGYCLAWWAPDRPVVAHGHRALQRPCTPGSQSSRPFHCGRRRTVKCPRCLETPCPACPESRHITCHHLPQHLPPPAARSATPAPARRRRPAPRNAARADGADGTATDAAPAAPSARCACAAGLGAAAGRLPLPAAPAVGRSRPGISGR
jgi:hypothetical protein